MKRFSKLFFTICSIISFLFYCLLYLQVISINENDLDKNVIDHKLEQRLTTLKNDLKDNQIVSYALNSKIQSLINKLKVFENLLPLRTDLCNYDKSGKLI